MEAFLETVDHAIEDMDEFGGFVAFAGEGDALVESAGGDAFCDGGDGVEGFKGTAGDPPAAEGNAEEGEGESGGEGGEHAIEVGMEIIEAEGEDEPVGFIAEDAGAPAGVIGLESDEPGCFGEGGVGAVEASAGGFGGGPTGAASG
ncbi:MAG: hypothetical protein RI897_3103 [Verrucomicrobiota bacterium]